MASCLMPQTNSPKATVLEATEHLNLVQIRPLRLVVAREPQLNPVIDLDVDGILNHRGNGGRERRYAGQSTWHCPTSFESVEYSLQG